MKVSDLCDERYIDYIKYISENINGNIMSKYNSILKNRDWSLKIIIDDKLNNEFIQLTNRLNSFKDRSFILSPESLDNLSVDLNSITEDVDKFISTL